MILDDPSHSESDNTNVYIEFTNTQMDLSSLLPTRTKFQFLQASSSKPQLDLDFQLPSEEMELGYGDDDTNKGRDNDKGVDDSDDDEEKSKSESTLDIGSSDEIVVPFALLDVQEKTDKVDAKVNVNAHAIALNSKLDLALKSLSEIKSSAPAQQGREKQLDQLSSLRLKYIMEELEKKYNENLDHHISTTTIILKIHDYMILLQKSSLSKRMSNMRRKFRG